MKRASQRRSETLKFTRGMTELKLIPKAILELAFPPSLRVGKGDGERSRQRVRDQVAHLAFGAE
jgi:hypothetical protein